MGLLALFSRKRRRRHLFAWQDGTGRVRHADPIQVWQSLETDPEFDLESHGPLAAAGDIASQNICARAAIRAVGGSQFSETHPDGLTVMEGLELLVAFVDFVEGLKKNTGHSPTSPSPTGSAATGSPTKNEQHSGSSESAPNSAMPAASTSASESR